jgi:hypothetical protein
MFALGQRAHHVAMASRSVVASRKPCSVRGCLAGLEQSGFPHEQPPFPFGEWTGKTGIPRAVKARAALSGARALTCASSVSAAEEGTAFRAEAERPASAGA